MMRRKKISQKIKRKSYLIRAQKNPNNYHNSIAGQPRGNHVAGQSSKYSNEQVITIKNFIKTNGDNEEKYESENSDNSTDNFVCTF